MKNEENKNIEQEQHVIAYNVDLLKWYFTKNKNITSDIEKEKVFSIMSYAMLEDQYCFMRILLYIANTRQTDEEELSYKILVHFLGIMSADIVMANLNMLLDFGKKDDVLYFVQCNNISDRILTFIKHKAKQDPDYKILMNGKLIKSKKKRKLYYRPKLNKDNTYSVFLMKILDDPIFNGITLPTVDTTQQ